ncbi:hypothetical protein [Spirosoma endophyticum]|uniref:Mannitol repressor n=1 Tax=Spirosoma endophyticum TaxID=662367 RepID=A0A1I2IBR2_9BACT|nr:hypothetical protein [Spirosoma endophyticum]SFF39772.1 Mannitol repressor [Spirosoma endophyticum]
MENNENPKSLKKIDLINEYPHLKDFIPLLDKLNAESPRGVALLSCSYIDELLKNAILAFLIDSEESKKLLEGFNAPLGTFSSRIAMAYSLGLTTEKEHKEILNLKKIRNACAHDFKLSFDDQKIKDLCNNLEYSIKSSGLENVMTSANQLTSSAVMVILNLVNRAHYVGKKKLTRQEWTY